MLIKLLLYLQPECFNTRKKRFQFVCLVQTENDKQKTWNKYHKSNGYQNI